MLKGFLHVRTTSPLLFTLAICLAGSHAAKAATGLDFPSNGDSPSGAFVAFQFLNPQNNGLPMWGPSNQGVTYIWKYRPRQQSGYYVTMWYSRADGLFNGGTGGNGNNGGYDAYYGAHPYPVGGGTSTTTHNWEIAGMNDGADIINTLSGGPLSVVKGVWYTQALRITVNGDGTKTARFYINLPSVANSNIITTTSTAGYGSGPNIHNPAITFGDSPWYPQYQHERMSGVIRGIKIIAKSLSESDLLAEAAADALVTSQGQANVWYMNINPTPTDISDKSGAGHNPTWASSARPALYTDSSGAVVPNPPTNVTVE
jgi:hypothetical protein